MGFRHIPSRRYESMNRDDDFEEVVAPTPEIATNTFGGMRSIRNYITILLIGGGIGGVLGHEASTQKKQSEKPVVTNKLTTCISDQKEIAKRTKEEADRWLALAAPYLDDPTMHDRLAEISIEQSTQEELDRIRESSHELGCAAQQASAYCFALLLHRYHGSPDLYEIISSMPNPGKRTFHEASALLIDELCDGRNIEAYDHFCDAWKAAQVLTTEVVRYRKEKIVSARDKPLATWEAMILQNPPDRHEARVVVEPPMGSSKEEVLAFHAEHNPFLELEKGPGEQ